MDHVIHRVLVPDPVAHPDILIFDDDNSERVFGFTVSIAKRCSSW
jgi:hypothetical protein